MDGFRGPRKGRSELMVLSEKKLYSLGRRCVYIFNRRKAKKEIPVQGPSGGLSWLPLDAKRGALTNDALFSPVPGSISLPVCEV